jgi:uncharacterized protein (TIGR02246 family)
MTDIESEKSALRERLDQLWDAYTRADAKAIAELYHSNANLILMGQEVAVGHQALEREYQKLLALDSLRSDTKVKRAFRIHLVTGDVAIVDAAARLSRTGAGGEQEKLGDVYFTIVAVKESGQWRLAAIRGANETNIAAPS